MSSMLFFILAMILLQHASIVSCLCVFGISHFGLYYLYSSTIPPKRFVRIRHYGLLSCRNKRKKITHCRNLLGCKKYISTLKNLNAVEMIRVLYHIDVCKCSSCGGNMVSPRKDKYSSSFRAHMRC